MIHTSKLFYRAILLFALCSSFSLIGIAGLNLPQLSSKTTIKGKDHQELKKYFEKFEEAPSSIDDPIEQLFIKYLPKQFKDGCKKMISNWGEIAKGTASTTARVIYLKYLTANIQNSIIVFTCYSSAEEYGSKFFDERIALLSIEADSTTLTMIPHANQCDDCSELTQIEFGSEIQIADKPALTLNLFTSNDNPCCGGSYSKEEVKIFYFILDPHELRQVLAVEKYYKEISHDDEVGDSTTVYNAELASEMDSNGNLKKISSSYEITAGENKKYSGNKKYIWNKKLYRFEESLR